MSFGRVLAGLVSAVMFVAAALMGALFAAFVFVLGLLTAAVVAARVWWLRRTLRGQPAADAPAVNDEHRVFDAEFTVVPERPADQRQLE